MRRHFPLEHRLIHLDDQYLAGLTAFAFDYGGIELRDGETIESGDADGSRERCVACIASASTVHAGIDFDEELAELVADGEPLGVDVGIHV